jgi:hypothetical protein
LFFRLAGGLFIHGELPTPNLLVEVRASGFQDESKPISNVDRKTIALAASTIFMMLKAREKLPAEEREKSFKMARTIHIPVENPTDMITVRIKLGKKSPAPQESAETQHLHLR